MPRLLKTPVRRDAWILTYSGKHVELMTPDPEEIDISDIARGLSRECRFTGQCREFYSVAQHSVLASGLVPQEFALEALLHDAAEAFIKDIPSPLKKLLPEYSRIEGILERVIRIKFGLPEEMSAPVRLADRILLATEKRDLMPHDPCEWPILEGIEPLPNPIVPWSPDLAIQLFLYRFAELVDDEIRQLPSAKPSGCSGGLKTERS
jgi:hypothetical protein